jgi:hypothetical protein
MARNSAKNSAKFALELTLRPSALGRMAQPLLETWSWTERMKASLKTIGTRRECPRPESNPPSCACRPALPATLPSPIRQSAVSEVAGFEYPECKSRARADCAVHFRPGTRPGDSSCDADISGLRGIAACAALRDHPGSQASQLTPLRNHDVLVAFHRVPGRPVYPFLHLLYREVSLVIAMSLMWTPNAPTCLRPGLQKCPQ